MDEGTRTREGVRPYQPARVAIVQYPVIGVTDLDRITFDPNVMGGRACLRDTRVTVSLIVKLVANGMTPDEILEAYPYLEEEDIQQSLEYASWLAEENVEPTV